MMPRLRNLFVFLIGVCWLLAFAGLNARSQDRIFGAAQPYADSYPRGEANDAIYEDYLRHAGPWGAYGYGWGAGPFFGWGRLGGSYLPWGMNSYIGPRYAPQAWRLQSPFSTPYYAWPYEWSYGLAPEYGGPDWGAYGGGHGGPNWQAPEGFRRRQLFW